MGRRPVVRIAVRPGEIDDQNEARTRGRSLRSDSILPSPVPWLAAKYYHESPVQNLLLLRLKNEKSSFPWHSILLFGISGATDIFSLSLGCFLLQRAFT